MQNLDINNGQAISNATSRDTKNIKEDIHRIFHQSGLWITIEANNKTIKFLGITFNLNKSTYQPFIKANIMLQYIYRDSNHLSITTENIPNKSTNDSHTFLPTKNLDWATCPYQKALDECGYQYYKPSITNNINTENGTTYSGTTLHSAKMSAPTSDTDSLSYLQKFLNGLLICLKKRTYPFNVLRKTLNCLFITLLGAVWSIILTFAWYSPVLEMQNDFIWFWSYLFRDHRKQVIIAS